MLTSYIYGGNKFLITEREQTQMTNEADDWIDEMPDGIQDRLSDAVNHAMHGFFSEIQYFRNISDTVGTEKYPIDVKNFDNGKLSFRLYTPQRKQTDPHKLPLFIFFHGGGWSLGSLNTTEKFCRALTSEGNIMVVSIDYPLSPEHPYPHAINQSKDMVEDIMEKASSWGADASKISLGGEGAGGNIALAVYNCLPDNKKIKSLVVYYPLLDPSAQIDAGSKRKYGRGYGFDSRLWDSFTKAYQGKFEENTKILPPTLIISAGRDIMLQSEKDFARSGNVSYVEFSGAIHGFLSDGHQKTAFSKAVELTDRFLTQNI